MLQYLKFDSSNATDLHYQSVIKEPFGIHPESPTDPVTVRHGQTSVFRLVGRRVEWVIKRGILFIFFILWLGCTQKAELRFRFKESQPQRFSLQGRLQAQITAQGQSNQYLTESRFIISQTPRLISPQGEALLEIRFDSVDYRSNEIDEREKLEVKKSFLASRTELRVNQYGEILNVEELKELSSFAPGGIDLVKYLIKIHPVLPQNPIRIGSRWEREQRIPFDAGLLKGDFHIYKKYKVLDQKQLGAYFCHVIQYQIVMTMESEKDNLIQTHHNEQGTGQGVIYFDAALGLLIGGEMQLTIDLNSTFIHPVTDEINQVNSNVQQKISLKLIEG